MKLLSLALFIPLAIAAAINNSPQGIDVSRYQGKIDWNSVKGKGYQFAYIKATEGARIVDSAFKLYYAGAAKAGLIRGAYHVAKPGQSGGAAQARYFLMHAGAWKADGNTLPGAVKFDGGCSGLPKPGMILWIHEFSTAYHKQTKRFPLIYASTAWWTKCTGNSGVFSQDQPLWLKATGPKQSSLPAGWPTYTFWQYATSGPSPGNQDTFNGDAAALKKFVLNRK